MFQDMTPRITKQMKLLIRNEQRDNANRNPSTKFAVATDHIPSTVNIILNWQHFSWWNIHMTTFVFCRNSKSGMKTLLVGSKRQLRSLAIQRKFYERRKDAKGSNAFTNNSKRDWSVITGLKCTVLPESALDLHFIIISEKSIIIILSLRERKTTRTL